MMTPIRSPQLELALVRPDAGGDSKRGVAVSRVLRAHRSCNRTLERLYYVLRYFPELDEKRLKVGLTRAACGLAVPGGYEIWLNPYRTSYHTIAHELVHLLQRGGAGIPKGERSCDVYSLARHWTLNDVVPNYVKIPPALAATDGSLSPSSARLLYESAVSALRAKQAGTRNYIAFFEETLRAAAATLRRSATR